MKGSHILLPLDLAFVSLLSLPIDPTRSKLESSSHTDNSGAGRDAFKSAATLSAYFPMSILSSSTCTVDSHRKNDAIAGSASISYSRSANNSDEQHTDKGYYILLQPYYLF